MTNKIQDNTYLTAKVTNIPSCHQVVRGTYNEVADELRLKNLGLPNGYQAAELFYNAYFDRDGNPINNYLNNWSIGKPLPKYRYDYSPEDYITEWTAIGMWLWTSNVNIWTPRNWKNAGVYVVHDSKVDGRKFRFNIKALEKELSRRTVKKGVSFSPDGNVSFAPYSTINRDTFYPEGFEGFSENGFMIASFGINGTEKLAKVAAELRKTYWHPINVFTETDELASPVKTYTGITRDGCTAPISYTTKTFGQNSQLYINGNFSFNDPFNEKIRGFSPGIKLDTDHRNK